MGIILAAFFKILFFLRMQKSFGQLVEMVGNTLNEIIPFILFFFIWISLFAILFMNFEVDIQDKDSDYYKMPPFFQFFFFSYRNSIGDISTPGYQNWYKKHGTESNYDIASRRIITILIWSVWIFN